MFVGPKEEEVAAEKAVQDRGMMAGCVYGMFCGRLCGNGTRWVSFARCGVMDACGCLPFRLSLFNA